VTRSLRLLDRALLDAVSSDAAARPRLRANYNFHPADDFPAHRLLNAIEPGSYLPPHRHLDPNKTKPSSSCAVRSAPSFSTIPAASCRPGC
jgi:cupin fold WbuC family metalloprotein